MSKESTRIERNRLAPLTYMWLITCRNIAVLLGTRSWSGLHFCCASLVCRLYRFRSHTASSTIDSKYNNLLLENSNCSLIYPRHLVVVATVKARRCSVACFCFVWSVETLQKTVEGSINFGERITGRNQSVAP